MQSYTYLLIDFFTVIICFIFSFHPKIKFNRYFGAFIKASVLVAILFIIWDAWFTKIGVWWFNDDYLIGTRLLGLPLEELMFFIFIPFSCVFTYYCLDKFFDLNWADRFNGIIVFVSVLICLIASIVFYEKIYPFVTAIVTGCTLLYLHFIAKANWIGKASFVYFILMLGFIPVNGILTGTGIESPIVNYNPDEILNVRILTIPIEDAVYGYAMFMMNLYFFKLFKKTSEEK